MALRSIICIPDPRLRLISKPVEVVDDSIRALMDDMLETMYAAPGIGLAAIQIAEPLRVVVIDVAKKDDPPAPMFFVNPELLWAARGAGPGFFGIVVRFHLRLQPRPKFVGMKAQVFRIRHLEAVMAWADRAGPDVAPFVEFQLVFDRKAMGIFAHGIQVWRPCWPVAGARHAPRWTS
jgi:hypothetical protein